MDLIDEACEKDHIKEFVTKLRASRRYNSQVTVRKMKKGDLVLKMVNPTRMGNPPPPK